MESGITVGTDTVTRAFSATVERLGDDVALRTLDDSTALSWRELRERVDAFAGGLAKLGLGRGETIALLLSNRPEFPIADLAAMTLGAVPFSIYQTSAPEQIRYVVADAGARFAVVERALLEPLSKARAAGLPGLETVIVLEGAQGEGTIGWDEVEGADPGFDGEPHRQATAPDDLVTLIYTSGTTGPPKGVQLTHRNVATGTGVVRRVIGLPEQGGRVISWLPAAHIAERMAHHYIPITFGLTVTCCHDPRAVVQEYLPAVRPTWFFAVPRIWEKLKSGLEVMLASQPEEARAKVDAAIEAAVRKVRLEQAGEPVPEELAAAVAKADEELFGGLRRQLGLDEVVAVNVGAAPTPVDVLEFFHAIGIRLAEIWGMSETCGVGTMNPTGRIKLGTVGPPVPGVELRLGDDDEVLVRTDAVMVGYRNAPDKTAEAIDADGWLHTGDIGTIDEDGYLTLVDRKKELIINAAGKNMSPSNIESALKGGSMLIGQACVIGNSRPFNTALVVLDPDYASAFAARNGIEDASLEALARNEAVREAVQRDVDAANAKLSRIEQVKRFTIVEGDWLPGGDELTPTMKLKRKPIDAKYAETIDAMYA